jgi:DNA replication protein DnaC
MNRDGETCAICGKAALCGGLGVISYEVPVGHEHFGRLFRCPNNPVERDEARHERLRSLSNLQAFADKGFHNFNPAPPGVSAIEAQSLEYARNTAYQYAASPDGWLLLEGTYGCGKTHLAAAVGNERLVRGDLVLLITVPDLLDHLRSTYGPSSETGYDQTFERIRDAGLLILDDLGAENPSAWAQEKLFQLLNYRYTRRLPTVVTTNIDIDRLDPRVRSRLLDEALIRRVKISAPDYRTPLETHASKLGDLSRYHDMLFANFDPRSPGSPDEEQNLRMVLNMAQTYARDPRGWLVLIGEYGCGKTHLAAAIANHLRERQAEAIFITVSDLLDYLRAAFNPNASLSFDNRFQQIKTADLLVLDDLGGESSSGWIREKLFQIIDYRYTSRLPTVITSARKMEDIDRRIATRLIDARLSTIVAITAGSYVIRQQRR